MTSTKKYGLIIRKNKPLLKPTKKQLKPSSLSAFNDSSSDEDARKEVNSQIHKEAMKKVMKKQTKLEIQRALEQDATVYDYDNVYDEMKKKSNEKFVPANVVQADKQKKPKYIASLLKAAENRGRERQRVEERKIERERKNEGDEFKDKPAFVTSAYKKRMEERQKEEEEERKMKYIEDAMDVKKQKDLSGFYKHLLRQQVGESENPSQRFERKLKEENSLKTEELQEKKEEVSCSKEKSPLFDEDHDTDLSMSSSEDEDVHKKQDVEAVVISDIKTCATDHKSPSSPSKNNKFEKRTDEDSLSTARQRYLDRKKGMEKNPKENESDNKFIKRTNTDTAMSARERYLARKKLAKPILSNDSD